MAERDTKRGSREHPGCQADDVRRFVEGRESQIDEESVEPINSKRDDKRRQKDEHRQRGDAGRAEAAGGD